MLLMVYNGILRQELVNHNIIKDNSITPSDDDTVYNDILNRKRK